MPNFIDNWLNRTTMYRVVLYYLICLLAAAMMLGAFGLLPYQPLAILLSGFLVLAVAWVVNYVFARTFKVPANVESVYITVLILALIVTPAVSFHDINEITFLILAPLIAMASKYILAWRRKHFFNPAALAVALTGFLFSQYASWWVGGNVPLLPFVLVGGILVVRKILRTDLVLSFMGAALASALFFGLSRGTTAPTVLLQLALHTPIFFFAFIMLTEPFTTPPRRGLRIAYGVIVGILFVPSIHVGSIYATPELALLVGNVFAFLVSPKERLMLKLKDKVRVAADVYEFVFEPARRLAFQPGQYMEWTLGLKKQDERGNRRYFTLASAPTESDLRLGIKFYPEASAFKKQMLAMPAGHEIFAGQLAGDFTLPRAKERKLAFIAGGIGITPFRSMLKYLLDKKERRDIVLVYSNRASEDIAYQEILDQAQRELGVRTVHTLTASGGGAKEVPADWQGERGYITAEMIAKAMPDWRERTFYISGPRSMVDTTEDTLRTMGVAGKNIKSDFFPGFV